MPVDLEQQLDGIKLFLKASGLASFCREAVEADDWIATLARQAVPEGFSVVIASSDKDFMQLVSPEVGLLNANDQVEKIWTAEDVRAKAAVNPDQIVDWLSLIGDSVDNIPGVPGVGPKTAADLLGQFGSVDSMYLRLGQVKSDRLRANLLASEGVVRRNQKLIRLLDELPFACLFDDVKIGKPDLAQLGLCYAEWGFKSLLAEVNTVASSQQELW